MKNLFVATDFSPHSDLALSLAKKFQEKLNTKVFHWDYTIEKLKSMGIINPDQLYKEIEEWSKKVPLHLVDEMKEQYQRCSVAMKDFELDVIEGKKFSALQEYFKSQDKDDLILITTSDDTFFERVFFGNFVEKLIFGTEQAVYLAKKEITHLPKKIGVCFDPEHDQLNFLNQVKNFAKVFECEVEIIYVESFDSRDLHQNVFATNQDAEKNKNNYLAYKRKLAEEKFEEYEKAFEKEGINTRVELIFSVDKTPAENLKKYFTENPVDLLFVEPHPGFKNGFRFNSTSYDLIKNVPVNFIVVKESHGKK